MTTAQDAYRIAADPASYGPRTIIAAARILADEVDRLNAELEQVRTDYADQTFMLEQLNTVFVEAFGELADVIGKDHHPAARLRVVTADTATQCDP
jgi:hypothetical protein